MIDASIDPDLMDAVKEGDDITYVEFKGTARVIEKRER